MAVRTKRKKTASAAQTKQKRAAASKTAAKKRSGSAGTRSAAAKKMTAAERRQLEERRAAQNALIRSEAAVVILFAVSLLLLLSLFGLCGAAGSFLKKLQLGLFGLPGYLFPVFLAVAAVYGAANAGNFRALLKIPAVLLVMITAGAMLHLFFGPSAEEGKSMAGTLYAAGTGGGVLGGLPGSALRTLLGTAGAFLVLLALLILLLVFVTERSFVSLVRRSGGRAGRKAKEELIRYREARRARREAESAEEEEDGEEEEEDETEHAAPHRRTETAGASWNPLDFTASDYTRGARFSDAKTDPASSEKVPETGAALTSEFSGSGGTAAAEIVPELRPVIFEGMPVREEKKETAGGQVPQPETVPASQPAPALQSAPIQKPVPAPQSVPAPKLAPAFGAAQAMRDAEEAARNSAGTAVPADPYLKDAFRRADAILKNAGTIRAGSVYDPEVAAPENPAPDISEPDLPAPERRIPQDLAVLPEEEAEPAYNETIDPEDRAEEVPEPAAAAEAEPAFSSGEPVSEKPAATVSFTDEEEDDAPLYDSIPGSNYSAAEDVSARTVVTANGKVIEGEFQSTQRRMEEARRAYRRENGLPDPEPEPVRQVIRRVPSIPSAAKPVSDLAASYAETPAPEKPMTKKESMAATMAAETEAAAQAEASMEATEKKEYVFPPLDLLEKGKTSLNTENTEEFRTTALKLQETLHSFGVDVTVTDYSRGPAVTRYELLPAQGVKVGKIVSLSDDIKLSLAAADIRIEAPIPGKSAVGIEVPNRENVTVYLRDLLESSRFRESTAKLAFAVGKDIAGQTVVTDIAKMPHLLIAGATGSGKSVCINTLIMSILYRYRPDDVKLIMIDPKVVELSVYNGIPHLLIPVVTEPKKAAGALSWAVAEMEDRYKKFASTGVRDLKGYNEKINEARKSGANPEELPRILPQIVIIIDELADLMMVSKNEVEEAICRIAQLARAAGMHLVIATQRPSVNVITGLIKANIPSRIAFAVSSGVDSRTILDGVGAEKLLGKGDMLFAPSGAPKPSRVQGAFVSDKEVQKVVDFIRDEALPVSYSQETAAQIARGGDMGASSSGSGRDELFAQAGRFIIEKKKASIGNLQRMFKIGFNRAARIMDQLCEAGVVGEEQGTKPREILMTEEQFEEFLRQSQ